MGEYYDKQGRPIDLMTWARLVDDGHAKRVAQDVLPSGYYVSTVWLGLNHRFGPGAPLIFESMVFPCDAEGNITNWSEVDADRYSTEVEALAGHADLVSRWREKPASSNAVRLSVDEPIVTTRD